MGIKYFQADDIKKEAEEICKTLNWGHIDFSNLGFLRSTGSVAPRTIARCHALGKAMQIAMGRNTGFYLVEVISEKFDKLSESEKTKTIIHELMHIPKTFGGGFIHHDKVHERNVKIVFEEYQTLKKKNVFDMLNKSADQTKEGENKLAPAQVKINPVINEVIKRNENKWKWF